MIFSFLHPTRRSVMGFERTNRIESNRIELNFSCGLHKLTRKRTRNPNQTNHVRPRGSTVWTRRGDARDGAADDDDDDGTVVDDGLFARVRASSNHGDEKEC